MKLYDAYGPNPTTVRLFILERGKITLDVQSIDILNLENRKPTYTGTVNSRGEVPALALDSGEIITEITAVCEYLDEIASSGISLIGATPEERAETRMWTRRVYLEICDHIVSWWRNGDEAADFYRGFRIPNPAGRDLEKTLANQALNRLDDELEGRTFICGERLTLADIVLFSFMAVMLPAVPWLNPPGRMNVAAWFERMNNRPNSAKALAPFPAGTFTA
jgi:glutathione S-transferase